MTEALKKTKVIDIANNRLCTCPPSHLNCLTAKEWTKDQVGIWQFYYNGHDIRDKKMHPATFPISLAKRTIELFTHKGELVIDPFVGSGTSLLAAQEIERNAVGFDINKKYIELSKSRLRGEGETLIPHDTKQLAIRDDARNINKYFENNSISLLFTSPPYANLLNRPRLNKSRRGTERKNEQYLKIEQYSQNKKDLGILPFDKYVLQMSHIYRKMLPLLKPRGHNVIDIPDIWGSDVKFGRRIPLHIGVYNAMIKAGYELRNVIIWDRNPIVNNIGIIGWPSNYITMGTTFEYLMDFWKPPIREDESKAKTG
ncbi:MAG: DNA methyltransferase [Thermoplasmataceae archaeon]